MNNNPLINASELLALSPAEASTQFLQLSLDQQKKLVLELPPGNERQDIILLAKNPSALVRSLSPEDLALTIKEIGEQDALQLIELSSNSQLGYILDLELWLRDKIDIQRLIYWTKLLLKCGSKRTNRFLCSTDFELLVLWFEKCCLFIEREAVEIIPSAFTCRIVTPDNYHYFVVKFGCDFDIMSHVINELYANDRERFYALTGNLGTTPKVEIEELLLRWRQGRLADRGWPDLEEALAIYEPRTVKNLPKKSCLPHGIDNAPHYFLQRSETKGLFRAGIRAVKDEELRRRVASEFANLVNRVIIADSLQPAAIESLTLASERVLGRVEIGLSMLGATNSERVIHTIANIPLLYVVQIAQGAIWERRQRAKGILSAPEGAFIRMLKEPVPERFTELMQPRPLFVADNTPLPREFTGVQDIIRLDHDLDLAEAALDLSRALELTLHTLPSTFPKHTYPESKEALTLQTLLFTLFANHALSLGTILEPLPMRRLNDLFAALPHDFDTLSQKLLAWTHSLTKTKPSQGISALVSELAKIGEQLFILDPNRINPHYVEGIWILDDRRQKT